MEPSSRYPASWQLPPGALPNPTPTSAADSRTKRRDHDREDSEPVKSNSLENRHEQVQMVVLNVFLPNAGGKAFQIAGRCGKWLSPLEVQALAQSMRDRTLAILQTYPVEIPKTEVVRFYSDFMANPLSRVRDWLQQAQHGALVQECNGLIADVNHMDEGAVQDRINLFLDRAEQVTQE